PLDVVSVTPEAGPVDQIDIIIIEFNQTVELYQDENWQQVSREIKLKGEKEEYTLTFDANAGISNKIVYLVNAVYNKANEWEITPITEEGKYTLDLADVIVNHAAEDSIVEGYVVKTWHAKNAHCEGTYTWTIGEDNGDDENSIDSIEAENGTQTIYDLTGRVVNKATNGIYIVNGKKMLVK
ncbi:MAG: hypothetical protein J6U58_01565, partial [Bacteroidaceae bacterium]|nr:hypothetical protein [Bacteroidaceae bacterium]